MEQYDMNSEAVEFELSDQLRRLLACIHIFKSIQTFK